MAGSPTTEAEIHQFACTKIESDTFPTLFDSGRCIAHRPFLAQFEEPFSARLQGTDRSRSCETLLTTLALTCAELEYAVGIEALN